MVLDVTFGGRVYYQRAMLSRFANHLPNCLGDVNVIIMQRDLHLF